MSTETITEICACGARLDWHGDSIFASGRLAKFRSDHQHIGSGGAKTTPTPRHPAHTPAEEA